MDWNYSPTAKFSVDAKLDSDSNIIAAADTSATAVKNKTLSVKGFKPPTDGQSDTASIGTLGNAIFQGVFGIRANNATAQIDADLEY